MAVDGCNLRTCGKERGFRALFWIEGYMDRRRNSGVVRRINLTRGLKVFDDERVIREEGEAEQEDFEMVGQQ